MKGKRKILNENGATKSTAVRKSEGREATRDMPDFYFEVNRPLITLGIQS